MARKLRKGIWDQLQAQRRGAVEVGSPPTQVRIPLERFWAMAISSEKHGVRMSWSRGELLW